MLEVLGLGDAPELLALSEAEEGELARWRALVGFSRQEPSPRTSEGSGT